MLLNTIIPGPRRPDIIRYVVGISRFLSSTLIMLCLPGTYDYFAMGYCAVPGCMSLTGHLFVSDETAGWPFPVS